MTTPTATIGGQLKSRRKQLGLTQQAAADLAGVVQPCWARAEAGRGTSVKQYAMLAAVLGLEFRGKLLRNIPGWTRPVELDT